jgi:thiol-disulfide isomerase/thioredoxin
LASWCAPCRAEAPDLVGAAERTADVAQFVGMNVKEENPAAEQAFLRATGVTYPNLDDTTGQLQLAFADTLPPAAIPSTLVIDADGRVAARVLGPITETTLVDLVTDVAEGR